MVNEIGFDFRKSKIYIQHNKTKRAGDFYSKKASAADDEKGNYSKRMALTGTIRLTSMVGSSIISSEAATVPALTSRM